VVVLHEIEIQPGFAEGFPVPRFEKEAPGVSEDLRLKQPRIVDSCLYFPHKYPWVQDSVEGSWTPLRATNTLLPKPHHRPRGGSATETSAKPLPSKRETISRP
jgi:hypothetical protein